MPARDTVFSLQGKHEETAALVEDVCTMLERVQEPSFPDRPFGANREPNHLLRLGLVDGATALAASIPRLGRLVEGQVDALMAIAISNTVLLFQENGTEDEFVKCYKRRIR